MDTDRYILNRKLLNIDKSNFWLHRRSRKETIRDYRQRTSIIKQDIHYTQKLEYQKCLGRVFGIEEDQICVVLPPRSRVLEDQRDPECQWPVFPRSRPIPKPQLAVLDLPNIRNDICSNILSWSSSDHIIAALGKVIWIWHVPTSEMFHHINCFQNVIALKANVDSTYLAFSCKDEVMCNLKIWSFETCKTTIKNRPLDCGHYACWITSIEYHTSNKYLIIGCRKGNLALIDTDLRTITTIINAHGDHDIIKIKCSPDGRYIASSGFDGNVHVWTFPDFNLVYSYYQSYCSRGLSWHPWKNSCLCVGTTNGTLALLNISLGKCIYTKSVPTSIIYDVTFNNKSGELVTSQTFCEPAEPETYLSQLNVLANFNHVVDRFEGHCRRVLFLEWSPDDHVLASAGSDETIHLWKFSHKRRREYHRDITTKNLSFNLENFIR